jgi:hypothetical protein
VLKHWIEKAWYDFEKDCPELSNRTAGFLDRVMETNPGMKKVADGVKSKMGKMMAGEGNQITKVLSKMPKPFLPKEGQDTPLMDIHPEEIARQLTLIEWNIWEKIQPWECLGLAWMKKDKARRSPHVLALIERFNYVSGWVATSICSQEQVKKRSKFIQKLIDVANGLRNLGNLNGVMEIVSGLNRGPVYRLKQSWDDVPSSSKKIFEELKGITDRQKNFANMRKYLKKVNPPCIPYLGLYLTDLTFIEEGNQDLLNGLINFFKRHQVSETIRTIKQYQTKPYALEPVQFIQDKLQRARIFDEDTLYEMSEYLEPRPGKERGPKPAAFGLGQIKKKDPSKAAPVVETEYKVELDFLRGYPYYAADAPSNIMIEPGTNSIKAGTLPKIVERLTHHATPDSNSLLGFFATYRTFTNPTEVMDLLTARYSMPAPKDKTASVLEEFKQKMQTPIYLRVFNAVKTWVDKHWYDFEDDPQLKVKLAEFCNGPLMKMSPNFGKVLQTTLAKLEAGGANQVQAPLGPSPPSKLPPAHLDCYSLSILDVDPEEMARQLCMFAHKCFQDIRTNEFLDSNYKHDDRVRRAPNLVKMMECFVSIRNWADNEINHPRAQSDPQYLLQVTTRLIEVCEHLLALNNMDSLKAIVQAIDRNGVQSLDGLSAKHRQSFVEKFHIVENANELKERVGALSPPCIPPMDYYLAEIERTEARFGKNMLTDKLINFEKWRHAGDIVVRLMSLQRTPYSLDAIPVLQDWLRLERQPIRSASVRGQSSHDGGLAASTSGNGNQLRFMMIDMLFNDEDFRSELRSVVSESLRGSVPKIKDDLRRLCKLRDEGQLQVAGSNPPAASLPNMAESSHERTNSLGSPAKLPFPGPTKTGMMGMGGPPKMGFGMLPKSPSPAPASTPTPAVATPPPVVATPPPSAVPPSVAPMPMAMNPTPLSPAPVVAAPAATAPPPLAKAPSFTAVSAVKQASIQNLMASLGKKVGVPMPAGNPKASPFGASPGTPPPAAAEVAPPPPASADMSTDEGLRAAATEVLGKDFPGCPLTRWDFYDAQGSVYGAPQNVTIDVIQRAQANYLCDIKHVVNVNDVSNLIKIGKLFRTQNPAAPLSCIIITANIDTQADEIANRCKIKVYKL